VGSKTHSNALKHVKAKQEFISKSMVKKLDYNYKLAVALVGADIAPEKLRNEWFRDFLEEFTNHKTPDSTTIRKNYFNDIKNEVNL